MDQYLVPMKNYLIKFWYFTDNRYQTQVSALSEVEALVLALDKVRGLETMDYWITGQGWKISIELAQ